MTRAGGSRRKGYGTREINVSSGMMALFPGEPVRTAAEKPTFLVYLPAHTAPQAEFILAHDANYTEIIAHQQLQLPQESGLLRIELSKHDSIPPLLPDQIYYWRFTLIYTIRGRGESEAIAECIQRVSLSSEVQSQLAQLSPQERLDLYLSLDLPYDAYVELDQIRRNPPLDDWVEATWSNWMTNAGWTHLIDIKTLETP